MRTVLWKTVAVCMLSALCPVAALAQGDLRPPPGAVFGTFATDNAGKRQRLNLTLDLSEAYDQNVAVPFEGGDLTLFRGSGFYTLFTPAFDFASNGERVQFALNASSTLRRYTDLDKSIMSSYSAGAGLNTRLWSGSTVSFNQGVTYTPALLYGLLAGTTAPTLGAAAPDAANYAVATGGSYTLASTVNLTQRLSSRSTLTLVSNLGSTLFTGAKPEYQDVHLVDGGGRFTYALNHEASFRLGYTYRQSQFTGAPRTTEQDFDIGIDYNKPLSKTRRTLISFGIGPVRAMAPAVSTGSLDLLQQYRLMADASLRHQMGRTWSLLATYHRGVGYIQGFQGPIFSSAYSTSLAGFLNRRTDLSISGAYSDGDSALNGTAKQFTTYTGDARLRYALGRDVATYVEYLFYYYTFNQNFVVIPGIPPGLTRNGLRVGVTLWVPARRR